MPFPPKNAYTGFNIFLNIIGHDVYPKGKTTNL